MQPAVEPAAPEPVIILMCTFNGAPWIRAQLDSIATQTHPNWVLWVSDDGSTDDTRALIAEFSARHPGRVGGIIDGPRRGSAANFLSLMCHAGLPQGYVALCDQDDVWLPHKLEHALAQLRPMAGRPCGWSGRFWISDAVLRPLRLPAPWQRGPSLENALVQNIMSGHTLTLNPEAFALIRRAGPVDVPHHDWWIYLVLMACEATALIDPEVVLHYRQHRRNTMGMRWGARARVARLAAVMNGNLRDWIAANLRALESADLPLGEKAQRLLAAQRHDRTHAMQHVLCDFAIHRQTRSETAALALARQLRRL